MREELPEGPAVGASELMSPANEPSVVEQLKHAVSSSGGRLRRAALCRRGARPLVTSPVLEDASSMLWDQTVTMMSGRGDAVLLPRGRGVAIAECLPDVFVVVEFDVAQQLGVAAVLARQVAEQIAALIRDDGEI